MKCKYCNQQNAELKKQCVYCGKILTGWTINNVTGLIGYRTETGSLLSQEEALKKDFEPLNPEWLA